MLQGLTQERDPNVLVGLDRSDDAGVYRLTGEIALIQTLDFFTPIVDSPYDFGRIAAANSLSDVYAMGGRPLTAMNIVCFPIKELDSAILHLILQGGLEIIGQAGAVLIGGHSVEDPEIKYGLSVTGTVHPKQCLTNAGARPGDLLVLTKPLGTGILATALKAGLLDQSTTAQITGLMAALNKDAAEAMVEIGVNACTDITGFGLLGHALEMAAASNVGLRLYPKKVPVIPEAKTYAAMGLVPAGSYTNQKFWTKDLQIGPGVEPILVDIMCDPQTSGGLLIAVPEEKAPSLIKKLVAKKVAAASIIGDVVAEPPGKIECR